MPEKTTAHRPVTVGDTVNILIKDLSHAGEGVGSVEGFTVFVPGTASGDLVRARIISVQKSYARALSLQIVEESLQRCTPLCPHNLHCGGCQLQHINYPEQLRYKEKLVRETLRRVGGLELLVLPVLGAAEPWRYRNKAQVPVAAAEGGGITAGFYEPRSHRVVDLEQCLIQHPAANGAVKETRKALQKLKIEPYNEQSHQGLVRHILTRISFATGDMLLALVTNGADLPRAGELVEELRRSIPQLTGIVQNINTKRGNTILGNRDITLWGKPYLIEKIGGLLFRLSTRSFFQVNTAQAATLYEKALEYASLSGSETLFDLYCGTGTIALFMSSQAKRVIGIESVAAAVEDARANAELNQIANAEFYTGLAEEVMPKLLKEGCRADVVVVDPPRKGCDASLLKSIAEANPERIVYVSCNPATLARDLKLLTEYGYRAVELQPVDMFPHTAHVECVIGMQRKDT